MILSVLFYDHWKLQNTTVNTTNHRLSNYYPHYSMIYSVRIAFEFKIMMHHRYSEVSEMRRESAQRSISIYTALPPRLFTIEIIIRTVVLKYII